jgi:hypothetical protein
LSKSSKYLVGAEFANLKIGGPADGYRTSMAKCPPKVLRMLYRGGGARASSGFASDDVAAYIIERYGHETDNFSHKPRPPSFISPTEQRLDSGHPPALNSCSPVAHRDCDGRWIWKEFADSDYVNRLIAI